MCDTQGNIKNVVSLLVVTCVYSVSRHFVVIQQDVIQYMYLGVRITSVLSRERQNVT